MPLACGRKRTNQPAPGNQLLSFLVFITGSWNDFMYFYVLQSTIHMLLCTCVQNLFRVTALMVKTLADIHEYVSVESQMLTNTINWLIKNCQNDDGSFSEKSQTIPLKLMVHKKWSIYDIILYFAVFWSKLSCFSKGAGAGVTEKTVFLTSFVMIGIKNAMKVPDVNLQVRSNQSET